MIFPENFEQKIGFDTIKEWLSGHCITTMGKERALNLKALNQYDEIMMRLHETEQFKTAILMDDPVPLQEIVDITPYLQKIKPEGTFLEVEELVEVRTVISTVIDISVYFRVKNKEEKYPDLWAICENVYLEIELLEAINRIINPKGELKDNSSDTLRQIRSEIIKISGEADRKIRKLLGNFKQEGLLKEDAEMTIRNGRLCIPVPAPNKRKVEGFIHDESATGQTVFIEPTEVFDANNELRDLLNAERREIIRILTELTNQIRFQSENLYEYLRFLGLIDYIRGKALLAIELDAHLPNVLNTQIIHWQKALHPILYKNYKKTDKKVVPLDLQLDKNQRILIISGPNAGGKSVCLKTVGLLQYMLQSGLLVPLSPVSDMGIFDTFFINMGDEQSIDNDLSTYSSHLNNIRIMIENMTPGSLFLIDEFGSGTEPSLGGAMAEAILEHVYKMGSFGIITTHFANLKLFSETHPEAVNGAMLFDIHAMKPLFILKQGKPGSSFTYEIAKKIGFPETIIEQAIQKSGTAQIDYERALEEVELEKIELSKQLRLVNQTDEQLAQFIADYQAQYEEFESQRKEILKNAKNQAIQIVENANKVIEKTIREIKEVKADSEKTKQIRAQVDQFKEALSKKTEKQTKEPAFKPMVPKPKPAPQPVQEDRPIEVGDQVLIDEVQTVGEVVQIKGNDVTVSFKGITFKTVLNKLTRISKKEAKTIEKKGFTNVGGTRLGDLINQKLSHFKPYIDLRGVRTDDAIVQVEALLDEAVLLSVHQVKILHGKGDGILRKKIREYLARRKEVRDFYDEILELGGSGITVVDL